MTKERDVVELALINDIGEILLQKKTFDYPTVPGGYWCFFGGELEKNESPEECIKREIEEEMGIKIKDIELVTIRDYELATGFFGKRHIFKGKFNGKISDIRLNEGGGFGFFNILEIDNIKLQDFVLKDIKEICAK